MYEEEIHLKLPTNFKPIFRTKTTVLPTLTWLSYLISLLEHLSSYRYTDFEEYTLMARVQDKYLSRACQFWLLPNAPPSRSPQTRYPDL